MIENDKFKKLNAAENLLKNLDTKKANIKDERDDVYIKLNEFENLI